MKLKELTPVIGNRYIKIQEKNTRLKSFMSTDEAEEEYGNFNVLYIEARSHEKGMLLIIVEDWVYDKNSTIHSWRN